ncbi:hypothetical protein DCAR_0206466 [Daucus carota subsp. sativus]|uniref:Uncharacterized protein n=1 Tax=Daucus carota subsp. sativus TaxID=79200 RepID=A0A169WPP7_DAUCS|nr:hypothetical protein DCAR_0206466 [Daucus carota subsp. sativus]
MVSITGKISLDQVLKDIKKKIKRNAELIKKESSEENMAPPEQFSGDPFSRDEVLAGINQDMHHPYSVQMPSSPYHHPYIVQQLQPSHHHLYTVQQPQPQPPYHHLYTVQPPQPQPPYHHLYTVQTPSLCDRCEYPYHYNH